MLFQLRSHHGCQEVAITDLLLHVPTPYRPLCKGKRHLSCIYFISCATSLDASCTHLRITATPVLEACVYLEDPMGGLSEAKPVRL